MRDIKFLVTHCTGTQPEAKIGDIIAYWKEQLGWKQPGYHYIIKSDGTVVQLLDEDKISNGVQGYNKVTINISYIGGVDKNNKPSDTRTPFQKESLLELLKTLKKKYPNAKIQGHRDFKGVSKACPSFNAKEEYKDII